MTKTGGTTKPMFHTDFCPEQIHPSVFIGRGAVIVGDVTLAEHCSIWFYATLRGDAGAISIGRGTNIQEGAILHADPGYPAVVGAGVTVGHGAIIRRAVDYSLRHRSSRRSPKPFRLSPNFLKT
jgi:carbonic anhydrase/acetyltransferase-like protein (isoleucine patch superfamily)